MAQATEHIGKTAAIRNHDHDLVQELNKRLDAVWRFDQYIENAKEAPDVKQFWHELKGQEQQNVERLKELIRDEVKKGNF